MALPLVDDVQPLLTTDAFGRAMRGYESVGSTNTEATTWAREGAAHGSVVVTEYQTNGRGRQGRSWEAEPGHNLMVSVILRPPLPPNRLGVLPLAAGVAVAEAVDSFIAPHTATVKWPNDVMIDDRKTCGMLLETSFAGPRAANDAPSFVVLGIGLNVNQVNFPDALADTATSLRLIAGRLVPRAPLFARMLQRLETRATALETNDGTARIRDAFHARMHRRGEAVVLRQSGADTTLHGTIQGITTDGALRLQTASGMRTVYAGDVTTASSSR